MELWGLDESFQTVKFMPYLNLQWKRRYYSAGQFAVQILAEEYDPNVKYLYSPERPELAMVQKLATEETVKGKFVNLSGYFAESIFDRQITFPYVRGDYNIKSLMEYLLVGEDSPWYKPDLFNIRLRNIPEDAVSVVWEYKRMGQALFETLQTMELSYRLVFDGVDSFDLDVWKGLDRTQSQNENAFALFAEDSPHVSKLSYTEDENNYKNVAMVMYGSDSAGDPYREDVYTPGWQTEGRRWLLVRSGGETRQEAIQNGTEELQKYQIIRKADVKLIQNADGLIYLRDFDLGDKCDVVSNSFQKSMEARITGVDEVFKANKHEVSITFGDPEKTIYQKMMRYVTTERLVHRE